MSKEQDLQSKYMEFQMLQQSIAQSQQKKVVIQNQIIEFSSLKESLENLQRSKKDSSMYSSLGAGVYVKAELKETEKVLVNIGSNIALERSVEESKKLVDKQVKELMNLQSKLDKELEEDIEKANLLNKELVESSSKKN